MKEQLVGHVENLTANQVSKKQTNIFKMVTVDYERLGATFNKILVFHACSFFEIILRRKSELPQNSEILPQTVDRRWLKAINRNLANSCHME